MMPRVRLSLLALALLAGPGASAAELQLYPLRIVLSKQHTVDAFKLTNAGDDAARVQLTLSAWDQDASGDIYAPTTALMANPPLFAVSSKATQTVRVGLAGVVAGDTEKAYRAFFQEVPDATRTADGIQTLLRISVPVFVPALAATPAALDFHAARHGGDRALLIHNPGNTHVQVTHLALTQEGKTVYERGLSLYVLAGRTMEWPVEMHMTGEGTVTVETDRGTLTGRISPDDTVPHP